MAKRTCRYAAVFFSDDDDDAAAAAVGARLLCAHRSIVSM